jgi:hypothetical protein
MLAILGAFAQKPDRFKILLQWEYDGATNCNDVQVLPGGNLLFNTGHGVREVARDKTVVFDYEPTIAY